jgi:hypothetical protein
MQLQRRRSRQILIVGNARQLAGHAFARDAGFAYWTLECCTTVGARSAVARKACR